MSHISVLPEEVVQILDPIRGGIFVDATLGLGGHSELLLAANPNITLIGIDQDPEALEKARVRLGEKPQYVRGNFGDLFYHLKELHIDQVDGLLMDIGVSSFQIDTPERGFSFQEDGPLDMRMDPEGDTTAASIVNKWPETKLAQLFFDYGEEKFGRKIARVICEHRQKNPFSTTKQLADLIVSLYPIQQRYKHPHPATRVFQALRIQVNEELEVLELGISQGLESLAPGGILSIISFHSLEDRIVKHRFREVVQTEDFTLLTKKPITASEEECGANPRSRSAKLRAIQKLSK